MADTPKHPGGRPTTYDIAFVSKAREYLEKSKDELDMIISQEVKQDKDMNGNHFKETKTTKEGVQNVKLPSIEGLAKYIGVSRSNIYKWRDEHAEFSDILEEILEEQAERLINMGLSGRYNTTITKLILTKHGYIEKQETQQSGASEEAKAEVIKKLGEKLENATGEELNRAIQDLLNIK